MRKIIYAMSVSLDGFIEAPGGDLSWSNPDLELHQHFNDREREGEIVLYGRRLYELMSAYWPHAGEAPGAPEVVKEYARIWLAKPKVVFSHTLTEVGWNARLFRGEAAEEVRRLKAQAGGFMLVGGAGLAGSLMQHDLIDEYHLYIRPVILGGGKPMLAALSQLLPLKLVENRLFGSGVVLLRYERQRNT